MPSTDTPRGRTGRPPITSRAQILTAARGLIDREGWEKLSIRRLAADMGIGATTLYHHVRDKEDLLLLLLNEYAEQTVRPELPPAPRERVVAAAIAMHDALAAWPWAAEVFTADGFAGRLRGSALWLVESMVAGAVDHGCTPAQAVDVFRCIWYYTAGEILVRSHSARRPASDRWTPERGAFFGGTDAAETPHLAAIGNDWPKLAARDIYAQGLRALVEGLLTHAPPAAG